ncbi:MAG: amidohydrolase family protein [Myxococcales bacterium]|nr:amidohydrolase family protein [Myxococcales bacterium]
MHDLVIRGGTVVDGSGGAPRTADVAIDADTIAAVGRVRETGRREIDADGLLVLPGWVDLHTHYDGQATWDVELAPSAWHGVTTTIFGNCSVGFAPVRPGSEDFLISLMEGVEDIPGSALAEGIPFGWESFPDYLDVLESKRHPLDIGAYVPHGPLRFFVMGDRGADHAERPTPEEIREMGRLAVEGIRAGAFGFSTSRTVKHRAADGRPTPSLSAADSELLGVAQAMGEAGVGVIQANSDFKTPEEWTLLRRMAEISGRPLTFSLIQVDHAPDGWRTLLENVEKANAAGLHVRAQVGSRPIGIMLGLTVTFHPFRGHETFREIQALPLAEQVGRLRDPDVRKRLLAERPTGPFADFMSGVMKRIWELGDPPNYEPAPEDSLLARAEREGEDVYALSLDLLLTDEGRALLYHPFENYSEGDLEAVREMMASPFTVSGLSDGGAHVATICDASFPTTLLTHWARDRRRGEKLPLEFVVHTQTRATAELMGLLDRGLVAPGLRADLNVVDFEALQLRPPELIRDLPAGGQRLLQAVDGYRHTIAGGVETYQDGQWTGATPGGLLRGPRPAPKA